MSTDWNAVQSDAITAAEAVLTDIWGRVATPAVGQITALVGMAQYIEENKGAFTQEEYLHLLDQQKLALKNVLLAYEGIAIAGAEAVVSAVMNVILNAAPALLFG